MTNTGSVRIESLLSREGMNLELKSKDRDSVLQELVEQVPQLKNNPEGRETLLRALRDREQLHSTGIGDGIALPHARNALVGLLDEPIIIFGRHRAGIPYGSIDAVPASLFFLLLAPNVTSHLAILARLSRILRDPKLRQGIQSAATPQAVLELIREAEARFQK